MILSMYAIKDELNGFTPPIPFLSEDLAKRYMKDQFMGNPTIRNTPEDFSLWEIAAFDTETGAIETAPAPVLVERAQNYGS